MSEEDEEHYSDYFSETEIDYDTYLSDSASTQISKSTATSVAWHPKQESSKKALVNQAIQKLCPYEKTVTISSPLPVPEYDLAAEAQILKKIVRTNNLLYIPVQVKVKHQWISVDGFIDTGGSTNLARPSLFDDLWKPLKHIITSETVGGSVNSPIIWIISL